MKIENDYLALDKENTNGDIHLGDGEEMVKSVDATLRSVTQRQSRWLEMYARYSKYLDDNQKVPTQKRNLQLYHWIARQKKLLHEGCLQEERRTLLEKLLARIDSVRAEQVAVASWARTTAPTGEQESQDCSIAGSVVCQAERLERQPVSQDDLWNLKWQAYMDYMEKYKRRPSKHHVEDMLMFNWFKHNKKLFNQGKMQAGRIPKFKQL
ncbi:MAG: helicase associated domain-containing protein [Prevotella sp.]